MNRLLKQQVLDGIKAGQFSEASRRRAAAGSRSVAPIGSDPNSSELRCVMPATRLPGPKKKLTCSDQLECRLEGKDVGRHLAAGYHRGDQSAPKGPSCWASPSTP